MYSGVLVGCFVCSLAAVSESADSRGEESFLVYREMDTDIDAATGNDAPAPAAPPAPEANATDANATAPAPPPVGSVTAKAMRDAATAARRAAGARGHGPAPAPHDRPNPGWGCEDKPPEMTGFEVHTDQGFLGYATCTDLADKCHNWINSSRIQSACPVSCYICDPNEVKAERRGPPCYDSTMTGVRFKNGPQATCTDLTNYCNHTELYHHVQAACRMTCGLCEAKVGHVAGQCKDLQADDEPEFMVAGGLASCTDMIDFCSGYKDAYLIRHKCPRTCGACPMLTTTTHSSFTTSAEITYDAMGGEEPSTCDRRRRWGFCSTRRRRNM